MRYEETQIGKLLEQIKLAVLADTPVVYIPTEQVELIHELLFSPQTANSIMPRMRVDGNNNDRIEELGAGVYYVDGKKVEDNYIVVQSFEAGSISKYPTLYICYMKDGKEWDSSITISLNKFVRLYLDIKSSNNYNDKKKTELIKKSLCIVVSPRFITVPPSLAPYTKTINVEPLSNEEIEGIITSSMQKHGLDAQIITGREKLLTQMKVSFRGMSAFKIRQLMQQMIRCQYIDFDGVLESEVTGAIQDAKKELLNNCPGLQWEKIKTNEAAGLGKVVHWLERHASLFKDPEKAVRQYVEIPKGILMTGIPGSGKSLMAMTAARLLNNMPLISLNMGMLRGGLVGESEHNLETALRTAESMAPCVLWIDEIEKAMSGSSSDGGDSGVGQRMFGTFLTWLQEKRSACFVFATSNDITRLPPELFRSERFDRKFFTFMPKAEECAEIFASIIRKQNDTYDKELAGYDKKRRKEMPQLLFDTELASPEVWLEVLNACCCTNPDDCVVVTENEGDRYLWRGKKKPNNKLLSGADISSIIKEAKFEANQEQQGSVENCFYEKKRFVEIVKDVIRNSKPYGETDLINLVKSFYSLNKNQLESASGACILDFSHFDEDELKYVPLLEEGSADKEYMTTGISAKDENRYNKVLFHTLVGAINHYLPILEKKGQLL